jgi:hypothetical protein
MESSHYGYSALLARRTLRDKKEDEYVRDEWLNRLASAQLDSFRIGNKDSTHQRLVSKAFFSSADYAQIAGDNIYFNPVVFDRREENPFKQPERAFPVDFAYGRKQTYSLNLLLPDGYVAVELPQNVLLGLPNEAGHFRRLVEVEGNLLQVTSQLVISQARFAPEEYHALREFYDRIAAAHAEVITIKRETASVATKRQ